ncbi:MAG: chemotaxis protein CheW [Candidatus Hydrothermae bacterium]|nr:chemotaxis protein CheW [Candidatus Hydrothermae bacterium]
MDKDVMQEKDFVELLGFRLGGQDYAIRIESVREVADLVERTRVPFSPRGFLGVMSLKGEVIPLIDLRSLFGFPDEINGTERVIVVKTDGEAVGFLVDNVTGIYPVSEDSINPLKDTKYVSGELKFEGSIVRLLDHKAVLESFLKSTREISRK